MNQIIGLINIKRKLKSGDSFIILKTEILGLQYIISPEYEGNYPDKIYFDDTLEIESPTNTINITNTDTIIKSEWNTNINSCKKLFKDLNNIKEIDLSNFNFSSITLFLVSYLILYKINN